MEEFELAAGVIVEGDVPAANIDDIVAVIPPPPPVSFASCISCLEIAIRFCREHHVDDVIITSLYNAKNHIEKQHAPSPKSISDMKQLTLFDMMNKKKRSCFNIGCSSSFFKSSCSCTCKTSFCKSGCSSSFKSSCSCISCKTGFCKSGCSCTCKTGFFKSGCSSSFFKRKCWL
jgi:hypothetical protein